MVQANRHVQSVVAKESASVLIVMELVMLVPYVLEGK